MPLKQSKSPAIITITGPSELRGPDLNQRPSGYEPDELPDCSTPRYCDFFLSLFYSFFLYFILPLSVFPSNKKSLMGGEGFEPSKAELTDLQSAPFGHSGIHPNSYVLMQQQIFVSLYFPFLLTYIHFLFLFFLIIKKKPMNGLEPLTC